MKAVTDALNKKTIGNRGRLHAVWLLAHLGGKAALDDLLSLVKSDLDPSVRAQAIRAVADLADPVLTKHKLDAGPGDTDLAVRLADRAKGQDDRVLLEIVIALGRLRWTGAPDWLAQNLSNVGRISNPSSTALAHAAMQTMRRSENWPAILKLLDKPAGEPIRLIALRAVAERYESKVVDGLIARLGAEKDTTRLREYADALTRVHQKPGPWVYWGYRPPPRPANTVPWERTEAIAQALDRVLADPDRELRLAVLRRMQREKVPLRLTTLGKWLEDEHQPERVTALLASLGDQPAAEVRRILEAVVRDRQHSAANRLTALALAVKGLDEATADSLIALVQVLEEGPVMADALRRTGKYPKFAATYAVLTAQGGFTGCGSARRGHRGAGGIAR